MREAKSSPRSKPRLTFQSLSYRIDASDVIVFTDATWMEFARLNGLAEPNVLGSLLWTHITDSTTANLYQAIVERVRVARQAARVTFRCDAPAERRFMLLEIEPEEGGAVLFRSTTRETQSRPRMPILDAALPRNDEFVTMCGWCKRILVAGQWLEVETAVEQLRLLLTNSPPKITHAICPNCERRFHEEAGVFNGT